MSTYPCPRCGQPTTGAFSEGGLRWAICEDCMEKDRQRQESDRRKAMRADWPAKDYLRGER